MSADTVLYVEDDENDVFFMRLAFQAVGLEETLRVTTDGQEAFQYLCHCHDAGALHPLPRLILLDLNLPIKSGLELLEWIRGQSRLREIPVVIITSSNQPSDEETARTLGAAEFLTKPSNPVQLGSIVRRLCRQWMPETEPPSRCQSKERTKS